MSVYIITLSLLMSVKNKHCLKKSLPTPSVFHLLWPYTTNKYKASVQEQTEINDSCILNFPSEGDNSTFLGEGSPFLGKVSIFCG